MQESKEDDSELPEDLADDLRAIFQATDSEVSPLSDLSALEEMEAEEALKARRRKIIAGNKEDIDGLPISRIDGDPSSDVIPGPRNRKERAVQKLINIETRVFDLTDESQAKAYSKETEKIFDPQSKRVIVGTEAPPMIVLDPDSPRGFRALSVLKTADVAIEVIKNPEYDLIERSKLKRSQSGGIDGGGSETDVSES